MKHRIGIVGVGLMGGWLAQHLLEAGYSVIAHDLDPAKVDAVVKAGAEDAARAKCLDERLFIDQRPA